MTKPYSGRLVLAEHAYRMYCLDIEPGITLQDLMKPEMWSRNTDGQVRPGDVVRVRSDTEGFDCKLIVRAILPGAGVIMRVDDAGVPGSPTRKHLEAIEESVRVEEEARHTAEIDAAMGGHP